MGVFQTSERCLNLGFLVGGNLVAEFAELFLGLEDHAVSLIEFVGTFLSLLVGLFVSLCLVAHLLDFSVAKAAGSLDTD